MKSAFFASTNQELSNVVNHYLSVNQAVEALLTDVYCCTRMRMCMPC